MWCTFFSHISLWFNVRVRTCWISCCLSHIRIQKFNWSNRRWWGLSVHMKPAMNSHIYNAYNSTLSQKLVQRNTHIDDKCNFASSHACIALGFFFFFPLQYCWTDSARLIKYNRLTQGKFQLCIILYNHLSKHCTFSSKGSRRKRCRLSTRTTKALCI